MRLNAVNFARGRQTPRDEWRPAPLKPDGEMELWLAKFGEFIDYTLSKGQIEYITAERALSLERSQPGTLTESEARELAATVDGELGFRVLGGKCYSASELHSLFACGPEREAVSEAGGRTLRVADIKKALEAAEEPHVLGFRQLPDCYVAAGRKVSVLDLTCTMAWIIRSGLRDGDTVALVEGILETERYAADNDLWGPKWRIFPEHFRAPNTVRMSKLQTWTLKPALFA